MLRQILAMTRKELHLILQKPSQLAALMLVPLACTPALKAAVMGSVGSVSVTVVSSEQPLSSVMVSW